MKKTGILLGVLLVSISFTNAETWFVRTNGSDYNNGQTWSNAFATVQKAITAAITPGDEIWVQAGMYYSAPICMRSDVSIYGGFLGNEILREQRNWSTNATILYGHGAHHVIENIGPMGNTAILDGFHIQRGEDILGGGIYNQNASPTFRNCEIYDNVANEGGGIYNINSSPKLINVKIYNNRANSEGGGITNRGSCSVSIENSSISNNASVGNGGGIAHYSTSSGTLLSVTISGNRTNTSGGGIYSSGNGNLLLQNCTITGNTAVDGAGIANTTSGVMTLEYATINNNTASNFGGGIFNQGNNLSILNSRMESNNAFSGGGMCNHAASPKLTSVTFTGNDAKRFGGGMSNVYDCRPTMEDLYFTNNHAESGGGMENLYVVDLKLDRITFDGNSASDMGGGVCTEKSGKVTISNTVITGNKSSSKGGGMCTIDLQTVIVSNVTISGNLASLGGGMYNDYIRSNNPQVYNTIIWGNQDNSGNNNVYNYNCTPIYSSSLVDGTGGSGTGLWGSYGIDGGNNIDANPQFVNYVFGSPGGDYRLQNGSPAIGTGDVNLAIRPITVDRQGYPRVMGRIDMGAYESGYRSLAVNHTQESEIPAILSENSEVSITMYPNPVLTDNNLFIAIHTSETTTGSTEIEVFNSLGAKVGKFQTTGKNAEITLPKEKGIYFVRLLLNDGSVKTEKVTVW